MGRLVMLKEMRHKLELAVTETDPVVEEESKLKSYAVLPYAIRNEVVACSAHREIRLGDS